MPLRLEEIRAFDPLARPAWARSLASRLAPGYEHPARAFFRLLARENREPMRWLDLGAGRNWLIGVFDEAHDEDLAVGADLETPSDLQHRHRFVVADAYHLPFADGTFHLVTAYWVAEHIQNPEAFLAEVARVLRPGGALLLRTTNPRSPVTRLARLLPEGLKRRLLRRFLRPGQVLYPTYDRLNHPRVLRQIPPRFGLAPEAMVFSEALWLYHPTTALLSLAYWHLTRPWPGLRTDIVALFRKVP